MTSTQMAQIIEGSIAARGRLAGAAATLEERRERMRLGAARMPAAAGITACAIVADGVPCEWLRPAEVADARVILYLHGGGYANGSLDTHRKLVGFLAASTTLAALSVGYRLAPEDPFPAAIDDVVRVWQWLLGTDVAPEDVIVAGDSAGGGLAMALCLASRDRGLPMPGALVLLSPWVDMTIAGSPESDAQIDDPIVRRVDLEELRDWYLAGADLSNTLASPARGELAGLPRTLVQVGERELLRPDAVALVARLEASGVDARCDVWDGMVHVWHFYAGIAPEADDALAAITDWLHPSA